MEIRKSRSTDFTVGNPFVVKSDDPPKVEPAQARYLYTTHYTLPDGTACTFQAYMTPNGYIYAGPIWMSSLPKFRPPEPSKGEALVAIVEQAVEPEKPAEPECTCVSLLFGHENKCPMWRKL